VYHTIEFAEALVLDLEISPRHPLEQVAISKGTRLRAQVRPYVLEMAEGPVEVADLFFEEGTATRRIRFAAFAFVD
jgi:hypothetical protein